MSGIISATSPVLDNQSYIDGDRFRVRKLWHTDKFVQLAMKVEIK